MAPSKAQIDAILDRAKADIGALFASASGSTTVIANLQSAINNAIAGDTLMLAPSFVDAQPITIPKPLKIIGDGSASLRGGVSIPGAGVTLAGFAAIKRAQDRSDIVIVTGDGATLLNSNVLGDPALGQKRGIAANAKGLTLRNVTVDDIFLSDQDSQAVCGWDNMIGFLAEDCVFSGAAETFLVGGADPKDQSRQPANVTLRRCTLTKNIRWKVPGVQVKNTLEFKNCLGALVETCVIENAWQNAQDGALIVVTPRNQDGTAPYSCVTNVVIQHCTGGHAATLLSIMGTDDEKPSGWLDGLNVLDCQFDDINPATWMTTGNWWDHNGNAMLVQRGPKNVTIDNLRMTGAHLGSALAFDQLPKCVNFTFINNRYPKTTWGTPLNWAEFVASGTQSGNAEV